MDDSVSGKESRDQGVGREWRRGENIGAAVPSLRNKYSRKEFWKVAWINLLSYQLRLEMHKD
jgi:hypothetical protein